jgi:TRAP-type C4-dicarboxylate transport system substrate-binding protein
MTIYDSISWWAKEMEKRTNGRFKVNLGYGGVFGKIRENPGLIKSNIIQMGILVPAYNPAQMYLGTLVIEPYLPPAGLDKMFEFTRYCWEHPAFVKQLAQFNIMPLVLCAVDHYQIYSNVPLKKPEDLKGVRIKGAGPLAILVQELGMTPVTMSAAEAYEGLQRGTIDAVMMSLSAAAKYKYQEVSKYLVMCDLGTGQSIMGVNIDAWKSLPQDIKDTHQEIMKELPQWWTDNVKAKNEGNIDLFRKQGVEVHPISPEVEALFKKASPKAYEAWLKKGEEMGFPARQYLKDIIAHYEKVTGKPFTIFRP